MVQSSTRRLVTESVYEPAQATQDGRLATLEAAAGFEFPPLSLEDSVLQALLSDDESQSSKILFAKFVHRGALVVNVKDFGAKGDYDPVTKTGTDDTAAFAAAIASDRIVYAPPGSYLVDTVRLDGAAGTFSRVALVGAGKGITVLHQAGDARAVITGYGDTTQSPNVLEARGGDNFIIKDLTVIANAKTGGVKPLRAMAWAGNKSYTYAAGSPVYVSTTATGEATTSTDKAPDVKVWKLAVTHVSGEVTNITADVTAGRWVPVNDFAAAGYYWYGESFNRNHGISITADKGLPRIHDVQIQGVESLDAAFASMLIGSGAVVHEDYITAGVDRVTIDACRVFGSAAGIGGANKSKVRITGCEISASSNLINFDAGSSECTVTGCTIYGDPILGGGNGISSYQSSLINVVGNTISDCGQGVNFNDTGGTSVRSGSIGNNTISRCLTGIAVNGSNSTAVSGNTLYDLTGNGIKVTASYNCPITGNTVQESTIYGFQIEGGHGNTVTGNAATKCGRDGFYFNAVKNMTVIGNSAESNNTTETATGSGFRLVGDTGAGSSADIIFTGNTSTDYQSPRKQKYGLYIGAGSSATLVMGNNFRGQLIEEIFNGGSANTIGFNKSSTTAFKSSVGILPEVDNTLTLGASTSRWMEIFAAKFSGYDGTRSIRWTNGNPNGTLNGTPGDMVLNIAGGAGATMWVKETGIGTNTGWVGK